MGKLQNLQDGFANTIKKTVKNVSLATFFLFIPIFALIVLGASMSIDITSKDFQLYGATLFMACTLLYFMWMGNGTSDGNADEDFVKTIKDYKSSIKNVCNETLRQFLVFESKKRKETLLNAIMTYTDLTEEQIMNLTKREMRKRKIAYTKILSVLRYRKIKRMKLAFNTVAELKGLETNSTNKYGETNVNAERVYTSFHMVKKFIVLITMIFVGASVSMSFFFVNPIEAVIKFIVAIITIVISMAGGYRLGFNRVATVRKNVLLSAIFYIDSCEEFAELNKLPFRNDPKIDRVGKLEEEIKILRKEFDAATTEDEPNKSQSEQQKEK